MQKKKSPPKKLHKQRKQDQHLNINCSPSTSKQIQHRKNMQKYSKERWITSSASGETVLPRFHSLNISFPSIQFSPPPIPPKKIIISTSFNDFCKVSHLYKSGNRFRKDPQIPLASIALMQSELLRSCLSPLFPPFFSL